MGALRLHPQRRRVHYAHRTPFGIVFLLFIQLHVDHIAWHNEWHEDHHPVHSRHGHPFCTSIGYADILQQWEFFILSAHKYSFA